MEKNNGNGNTNAGSSYVGAPYNFVPFAKEPYALNGDSQVPHDVLDTERFDGEIRYRVTAKTPIFVSDGFKDKDGKVKADFARNQYGEYAIPGNTMRGLVRNNLQILSESSFNEDVDDYRMMFREVAGGSDRIDRKRYAKILGAGIKNLGNGKQVSILKWVKAGYLVKENGKYFIYGTVNDTDAVSDDKLNYYIISEREIINQYVDNGYKYDDFSFFFDNPETYLQHKTMKKFKKIGEGKRAKYVNDENNEYIPYMVPVAYKASSNGKVLSVKALSEEIGEDYVKGYALSSGPMKNKKVIYIIPEINREGKCIDIQATDPDAIKAFRIDYEKRKNGLKPVKAYKDKKTKDALMQKYYDLPDESQIKPVFYIEHEGLYFGYTPRLRLFNDYSIKGGMSDDQKKYIFDHSKSLFGYSNDKGSYKSRLSFSDAVITKEGTKPRQRIGVILAEPKPSSFADYLVQDGETIKYTYNSDKFELRGVKQYWLHDKPVIPPASDKEAVKSTLYPLSDGTEFEGVVRFSNLDKLELGLLLWSIRLEENSYVNIGQGKAYGYGVSKVDLLSVKKYDREKAYDIESAFVLNPYDEASLNADELIGDYKEALQNRLGTKINSNPSIRAFILMKNSAVIPHESLTEYMSVNDGDYRNRTALKDVQAIVAESRQIRDGVIKPVQRHVQVTSSQDKSGSAQSGYGNQGSSDRRDNENRSDGGNRRGDENLRRIGEAFDTKEGKVKYLNQEKGFGFIKIPGETKDVYFRISTFSVDEQGRLSYGKKVRVSIRPGKKGPEAVSCELI